MSIIWLTDNTLHSQTKGKPSGNSLSGFLLNLKRINAAFIKTGQCVMPTIDYSKR